MLAVKNDRMNVPFSRLDHRSDYHEGISATHSRQTVVSVQNWPALAMMAAGRPLMTLASLSFHHVKARRFQQIHACLLHSGPRSTHEGDAPNPEVPIPQAEPDINPQMPPDFPNPTRDPEFPHLPPPDISFPKTAPDLLPEVPQPGLPGEFPPPFEPEIPSPREHPLPEIPNPPTEEPLKHPGDPETIPPEVAASERIPYPRATISHPPVDFPPTPDKGEGKAEVEEEGEETSEKGGSDREQWPPAVERSDKPHQGSVLDRLVENYKRM